MTKKFTVDHYKGCKRVELTPEGSLIVIAGSNGAGKSSFIDAFVELFDPKGTRLTPKPIHEGAYIASATYEDTELGLRITRKWTKNNDAGKLEVQTLDGAKYSKPADVIKELTGGLIFDPVAFLRLSDSDQRKALLRQVQLPFDLDQFEADLSSAQAMRTNAGREAKRLAAVVTSMHAYDDAPESEVSGVDLLAQIQEAQDNDRWNKNLKEKMDAAEAKLESLKKQLASASAQWMHAQAEWRDCSRPVPDVDDLRAQLAQIDETNAKVRANAAFQAAVAEAETAARAHDARTETVKALQDKKDDALAEAEFPIDGLSVDVGGITFNGLPFSQVNDAAKRKVAFAIATANQPKLRLVIIKDGDLLDATSLEQIRELADERGYTVLMERDRDDSRKIGFTIVDGELAA